MSRIITTKKIPKICLKCPHGKDHFPYCIENCKTVMSPLEEIDFLDCLGVQQIKLIGDKTQ